MRSFLSYAVGGALAAAVFAVPLVPASARDAAGNFSFYVLSLSWAPSFCAGRNGGGNKAECGAQARYGFIVHGLWPQNANSYPESCRTRFPLRVPGSLGRDLEDIMPGMSLIGHEWRKHGTCSGLDQASYFRLVRKARDTVAIPPEFTPGRATRTVAPGQVEAAFVKANPGLRRDGIAVTCSGSRIEEVHICLTKSLQFRPCPSIDAEGCHRTTISIPGASTAN